MKRGIESVEQQQYLKAELHKIKIQTQLAGKSRETAITGPVSNKLLAGTQVLPIVKTTNQSNFKQSPTNMKPPAIPG